MSSVVSPPPINLALPDHTQLPAEDDTTVAQSIADPYQAQLLSQSIEPVLRGLHPDGRFTVGQDNFIYWQQTKPPTAGARAPDWFYVPNVPRMMLQGIVRRSYVLWQEHIRPLVVMEFVSGDGSEERDRTPKTGKFWIYEHGIQAQFYAIYERDPGRVELYRSEAGRYQPVAANERGHLPIPPLGVELGIWLGRHAGAELPWLRWWDLQGRLLLTPDEQLAQEQQARLEAERKRNVLADKLRELGLDPDAL
jgi:Uma2 family endonuclease